MIGLYKGYEGLSGSAPYFDIPIIILLLEKLLVEKFDFKLPMLVDPRDELKSICFWGLLTLSLMWRELF
jgi:hypothetical protein